MMRVVKVGLRTVQECHTTFIHYQHGDPPNNCLWVSFHCFHRVLPHSITMLVRKFVFVLTPIYWNISLVYFYDFLISTEIFSNFWWPHEDIYIRRVIQLAVHRSSPGKRRTDFGPIPKCSLTLMLQFTVPLSLTFFICGFFNVGKHKDLKYFSTFDFYYILCN